jgi:hypothetical protein
VENLNAQNVSSYYRALGWKGFSGLNLGFLQKGFIGSFENVEDYRP